MVLLGGLWLALQKRRVEIRGSSTPMYIKDLIASTRENPENPQTARAETASAFQKEGKRNIGKVSVTKIIKGSDQQEELEIQAASGIKKPCLAGGTSKK